MKLRCTELLSPTGKEIASSLWLKLGSEYTALTLSVESTGNVMVRFIAEGGTEPTLFPLRQFEIVDSSIPATWVVWKGRKGGLNFGPQAWSESGFWERYFDGDPSAVAAFETERSKVLAAE